MENNLVIFIVGNRSIMFAAEGNDAVLLDIYIYRGGEAIPDHVTHVYVANLSAVPARAFRHHPNIEEVECDAGVEKIEEFAFDNCASLKRVIMPGVKKVEWWAFHLCRALTYIECGKLEIIGMSAFSLCQSLSSIDLPSIKIVGCQAFRDCKNLTSVIFGKDLESIRADALRNCHSLERITLPLKNGMMTRDNIFQGCVKLNHIDLVEGEILDETVTALLMEEWKNDMNEEIDSISQILPNTPAGTIERHDDVGEKAREIRAWIGSVLRKIVRYRAEHQRTLDEAAAALQPALPNDIVLKNVLAFLELPSYTFDGEN